MGIRVIVWDPLGEVLATLQFSKDYIVDLIVVESMAALRFIHFAKEMGLQKVEFIYLYHTNPFLLLYFFINKKNENEKKKNSKHKNARVQRLYILFFYYYFFEFFFFLTCLHKRGKKIRINDIHFIRRNLSQLSYVFETFGS